MTALIREVVAPGVARLVVPTDTLPPATSTNAWLLGTTQLTVVDPGASDPEVQEAVVEALARDSVRRILLTHHHPDHTSGAHHLASATGAPIAAHPDTASWFGPIDEALRDGDLLRTGPHSWRVVHTPGHAHGHICLLRNSDGLAVVGDLVAGEGTILVGPPEGHLATYLHSLQRMLDLGATRALPAHGPALDAQAVLQMYLEHRGHRTRQVESGLRAGIHTPLALAREIYPDLPESFLPIAAHQLRAHLTWWTERGQVYRKADDAFHWIDPPNG